eukprot:1149816-Pelagomonas_calceolata.AAC.10
MDEDMRGRMSHLQWQPSKDSKLMEWVIWDGDLVLKSRAHEMASQGPQPAGLSSEVTDCTEFREKLS